MAIQTLKCIPGAHTWRREGKRGKPPKSCPTHAPLAKVVSIQPVSIENSGEDIGPVISGKAMADRLMNMLESRGQALHQQTGRAYSGPRY